MAKVIFAQPFLVGAALAAQCEGRTVVLDLAFNAGSPQGKGTPEEQFAATTQAFIDGLGENLVGWLDHHDHKNWPEFAADQRFTLVPRTQAPACPPIVTPEWVSSVGEVGTIVAHGDFDGVMSAVKFALGGSEPYDGANADALAADTRKGTLSPVGQRLEEAMKANLADNAMRVAVFDELTTSSVEATAIIDAARLKYQAVQAKTADLAGQFQISGNAAVLDASKE